MTNPADLRLATTLGDDPLTAVGEWIQLTGKVKEDATFVATELSSVGHADRERLRLRGPIESIDVAGKVITVTGIALRFTDATKIQDLERTAMVAERLRVSQPVVVYATPSDEGGEWTATRIRLADRRSVKWQVEGTVRRREPLGPEHATLEVGPLRVNVDELTSVIDVKHRAARVVPFNPRTWQNGRRELIWSDPLRLPAASGYGTVARQLIVGLARLGVDITISPTRYRAARGLEPFYKPLDDWGKLGFYCHWELHPSTLRCEHVINCSMWESTRVPEDHVDEINAAAALQYVPCQQNADSFRECGVRVPIKVLHYGVDARRFPYLDRKPANYFTFGTFGELTVRKGIDVLIRAFRDEFRLREPVRLLLKTTSPIDADWGRDPRMIVASRPIDHDALLKLLRQMDAFVMPSRGEGFGLCGLEAMSTGLPLIATNWGGPVEYLDSRDSFPLSYRLVEATNTRYTRFSGLWAEPDYEHLRHLMRWVYEHREQAAETGRAAAARVRRDWTWDRVAKQVVGDLDELVSR